MFKRYVSRNFMLFKKYIYMCVCVICNVFRVSAFSAKLGRRKKIEKRSIDREFLDTR